MQAAELWMVYIGLETIPFPVPSSRNDTGKSIAMDHPKIQHDDQGNLFLNFGEYGESVEVAASSGDGKRMLTVREVGIARVWDIDAGTLIAELVPDSPLTEDAWSSLTWKEA